MAAFPAVNVFVEEVEIDFRCIHQIFLNHLATFLSGLGVYIPFTIHSKTFNWVRSPFEVSALCVHCKMDCSVEHKLELQSRQLWIDKINNISLTQFLANV